MAIVTTRGRSMSPARRHRIFEAHAAASAEEAAS